MNIAFLAHDKKKELMVQFCTAYKSVLMKHNLSFVYHIDIVTQPLQICGNMGADQDTPLFILFHIFPENIQHIPPRYYVKS